MSPATKLPQYSIRAFLLVIALCAIGIACWKAFIWEPPTNKISQYEKALVFHGTTATIGPNQMRILSVARNDREGGVQIENGRGKSVDLAIPNQQLMIDCAPWLDVAQIQFAPNDGLVDIIEVRIFDHKRRELITHVQPRTGWRLLRPSALQLYGLGKALPEQIDLWLRVASYNADDPVKKLAAAKDAAIKIENHQISINAIQAGYTGWSSADGFFPVVGQHHADCAIELTWDDEVPIYNYQIAAVKKDGLKLFNHSWPSYSGGEGKAYLLFPCPLEDIDHFEIRPSGGMHKLFFNGLKLPSPDARVSADFKDAPKATHLVGGKPVSETKLAAFAPLDIRLTIADGKIYSGSFGGNNYILLTPQRDGPKQLGSAITLGLNSRGLAEPPLAMSFRIKGQTTWTPTNALGNRSQVKAMTGSMGLMGTSWAIPMEDIDEVEFQLLPVP